MVGLLYSFVVRYVTSLRVSLSLLLCPFSIRESEGSVLGEQKNDVARVSVHDGSIDD